MYGTKMQGIIHKFVWNKRQNKKKHTRLEKYGRGIGINDALLKLKFIKVSRIKKTFYVYRS